MAAALFGNCSCIALPRASLHSWEHVIRDEVDYARHVDYVHWNPIKHGLVQRLADWPYSSFHRYVESGIYPPDWAGAPDAGLDMNETV